MTNGERIRQMTDEELAEIISFYIECRDCPCKDENGIGAGCKGDCQSGAFAWLKQEVPRDDSVQL